MKKIFIYTAILATFATSCSKLENEPLQKDVDPDSDVVMITEKVSANVNPSSKADIDADANFTWSAGDQLAVHVSDGKYYTTDALASGGSKSATFSVTYPDGKSRDAFAIYPASIVATDATNYGQSGTALDVTLPASYTLAEVSGTKTPCPMIADNTGSGWTFKQLCGLLRLTVNNIPSDATGLKIQFPGSKVNGSFSLESPVSPETSTIATTDIFDDGEDKITVNFAAGITSATVNIPLPIGNYKSVYISSVGGATKVVALHHIKANGYTATRAKGKKLTTTVNPLPVVTRSDGGDEDECIPYLYDNGDMQYDFTSPNLDPAKITIDGNSTFRFYFDTDPAVVTLTGSGDPVSSTWTGHNAFIESDDDLTIILDCNYVIDNSFNSEKAIDCGGNLKLATTGGTHTLTVITNDDGTFAWGIYGDSNWDCWMIKFSEIDNLAATGFTVSCPGPVDNLDGTYTWVYTVSPVTP